MEILQILIVGSMLSGAVQFLKEKFGTSGNGTKAMTVVLALVVGAGVYFLQDTEYWKIVLGVLGTASTVYSFLLKKS